MQRQKMMLSGSTRFWVTTSLLLGVLGAPSLAQTPGASQQPTLEFHYENAQQQPARYTIILHEDGSGRFHAEPGEAPLDNSSELPNEGQDRAIRITAAPLQRMFAIARAKKFFAIGCETGGPKVAFTGKKQLSYSGPEGQGSCQYNYSRDPQLQWITSEMQGIAATLEAGRRLQIRHEHGRLSLDAELETLETEVQNGQAVELGNIAPILIDIIKDDAVLERAQTRARKLLRVADTAAQAKP